MNAMEVKPHERGLVRLFKLNMRPEEARFLKEPGAAAQVLGVEEMEDGQVEIFPVSDLEELGLAGYLREGLGVPAERLDTERLAGIEGWVMVVRSPAFGGRAETLRPAPKVELVDIFAEEGVDWTPGPEPLEVESAKPHSTPRVPPRQARQEARNKGAMVFAIVMALVIGGLLWLIL
ncbi:hypothetical protein ACFORG_12940 [Lutimaribacter marinistellae]|uniref:Aspartate carbamoyltransferase catalytic subunit n=1 Tax=Lutimaribacter marinistellae TaxID=1820329 RepID=A0ABV7TID2_9RHOB